MMSFHHPLLLIGLAGAIVPILIYFLTRDRILVVPFSTLRFFAGTSASLVRRKKWLETLLLALRSLLCALFAVAFARPYFAKHTDAAGKLRADQAVVVAIDVSQSMARAGAWKSAVAKADTAIDALPGGAAISLVSFDQAARVESTWADAAAAKSRLASLQPAEAGTDLVGALRKADELLADISADHKRVVLVSDLPRAGLTAAQSGWKLRPGVSLQIEAATPDAAAGSSVAIIDANLPQSVVNDRLPHAVTVRLANFSAEPAKDLSVDLTLPGQPVQSQKITVPGNQQITASFRPTFADVGDHAGTITLTAGSTTETLYLNVHVLPRIGVAILSSDADAKRPGSATFFLAKAIHPAEDSPFDVRVLSAATASAADLEKTSVLIVSDVSTISTELKQAIADFHHRGGGVLLLPGSKTDVTSFTADFGAFAPAQLRRIIQATETRKGSAKALITRVDLEHPIFEIFQRPHSGDFSAVAISQYWEVTDSQLSHVPMRLDDGRPFMLEKTSPGGASCVLIASPPDLAWNNFPQRAIYLPLLHQTLRYLATKGERATTYAVGDLLPVAANETLHDPAGKSHAGASLIAAAPGLYTIDDSTQKSSFTYAVNTPFAEADATVVPPDELKAAVESPDAGQSPTSGSLATSAGSRELWSYLIALSLVLVMAELFVSNKVPRH